MSETLPYCGPAPLPGGLGWSDQPLLWLAALAGLALAARAPSRGPALLGWGVAALALLSPLCHLAVALFSARVGQHLLLLLAAAPLLALGWPGGARSGAPGRLAAATGLFAGLLWLWHLPGPYGLTFRSDLAWWALHLSLPGAALWLWRAWVAGAAARPEAAILSGLATAAQMGALGAFLTFAPRPLFLPHALTTLPWGWTPLEDQQLGGLLMWVPGGIAFALLSLIGLARALRAAEERAA